MKPSTTTTCYVISLYNFNVTCFGLSSTSQHSEKLKYQRKTGHVNYIKPVVISVNKAEISKSQLHIFRRIERIHCRSQWPRGLRLMSAAARLLRLWVRIPPGTWMFVYCECCVLSGTGLYDRLITRPEESYRLWCVIVCDLETSSRMRRPWSAWGCSGMGKKVFIKLLSRFRFHIK